MNGLSIAKLGIGGTALSIALLGFVSDTVVIVGSLGVAEKHRSHENVRFLATGIPPITIDEIIAVVKKHISEPNVVKLPEWVIESNRTHSSELFTSNFDHFILEKPATQFVKSEKAAVEIVTIASTPSSDELILPTLISTDQIILSKMVSTDSNLITTSTVPTSGSVEIVEDIQVTESINRIEIVEAIQVTELINNIEITHTTTSDLIEADESNMEQILLLVVAIEETRVL